MVKKNKMEKINKADTEEEKSLVIDTHLKKKFGDNIFVGGNLIIDTPKTVISTSPAIDLILGGGIPEGSFVLITGQQKIGKTNFCLNFASCAQKSKYNVDGVSRHIYYFNIEGRIKSRDLTGITALKTDPDHFTIIQSAKGKILTAEEYIEIAESLIKTKPGSVFILDSASQLCTEGEMTANIGDRYRADAPLLLARFCRRISNVLPINNSIVIGITHQIANQGTGYSQWVEASGRKIQYQADVKLKALYMKPYNVADKQIGHEIYWECQTSALGPPNMKGVSLLRYGEGMDKHYELVSLGVDIGLIDKGGAWYKLPNGESLQGMEKTITYLKENPTVYDELEKSFRDMLDLPKD